ncbi:uncharacterized protein LOC135848625 [Planococcus citri]|uniref:uncharacterized protein LOC135848625 n=1 Tax=Planococcus citri TaxID=170843 RepID=UPI0031F7BE80
MRRILPIVLFSTLYSSTHQASIAFRDNHHPSIAEEKNLQPSAVFDNVDVILDKIDTVAKFARDYNAIPKIGQCLHFLMHRFETGRKFLMHYNEVKAQNEGRFPSLQKPVKAAAATPKPTQFEYIYIYPSQAALGMSKALSMMKKAPEYSRMPQALKRVSCYNCRTRKEQWKRYNYFQNRRKRWPKQFYNPKHIIPASNEQHLFDYVTVTVKPTTEMTIKSFRDILPGPNQLPYYANMFLDVFDTHFETWNSKIRSAIHSIKQKWAQRKEKNKNADSSDTDGSDTDSSSRSSSYSSSESRSDLSSSSSEYVSRSTSSESGSGSNYTSSEYSDKSDESSRTARSSEDRSDENGRNYVQNVSNRVSNKQEEYEYYSDSNSNDVDEQESSRKERVTNEDENDENDYESADYSQNHRESTKKRTFRNRAIVN